MGYFLAEDGGTLLLEDGGALLLEDGGALLQQTIRQAIYARLVAIDALAAIVGSAIFPGSLPQTHRLESDGPALTYTVATNPRNHHLGGTDGTATARVQFGAWGLDLADTDAITQALLDNLDGAVNETTWGNGSITVRSCLQLDEVDLPEPARVGTDRWIRQIASDYSIKYTVTAPTP